MEKLESVNRMKEMVARGSAIDFKDFPKRSDGSYVVTDKHVLHCLEEDIDKDFCDTSQMNGYGMWIWSIGKDAKGNVFAALDTRFYLHPEYECIWLR
jgi:hypothetical protein